MVLCIVEFYGDDGIWVEEVADWLCLNILLQAAFNILLQAAFSVLGV